MSKNKSKPKGRKIYKSRLPMCRTYEIIDGKIKEVEKEAKWVIEPHITMNTAQLEYVKIHFPRYQMNSNPSVFDMLFGRQAVHTGPIEVTDADVQRVRMEMEVRERFLQSFRFITQKIYSCSAVMVRWNGYF